MDHKKLNIGCKLDGKWNKERKIWLLKLRKNNEMVGYYWKIFQIQVSFWMNFELICLNKRDFDDGEVENLWEKEEVKFSNFLGKKCL